MTQIQQSCLESRIHEIRFIRSTSSKIFLCSLLKKFEFTILADDDDDNDDDDDDNDDDLIFRNGWLAKGVKRYFQPKSLLDGFQHRKPPTRC